MRKSLRRALGYLDTRKYTINTSFIYKEEKFIRSLTMDHHDGGAQVAYHDSLHVNRR